MANILGDAVVGTIRVIYVDENPATAPGTKSLLGTIAMFPDIASPVTSGLFQKFGPADTDWREFLYSGGPGSTDWALAGNILTGTNPENPNEQFGSVNDFDVKMVRNGAEQLRLVDQAWQQRTQDTLGIKSSETRLTAATVDTSVVSIPLSTRDDSSGLVNITVIGRRTDVVGTSEGYKITVQYTNIAGTVTAEFQQDDYTYNPEGSAVVINPTANTIDVEITGVAGQEYNWFVSSEDHIVQEGA